MKDKYTVTEVGALVESLRTEFRVVAEEVRSLSGRMTSVETRLTKVEIEAQSLNDIIRVAIPYINSRLAKAGI